MMSPGMVGINQGMAGMTLQSPGAAPMMGGGMPMMGGPRPVMGELRLWPQTVHIDLLNSFSLCQIQTCHGAQCI